MSAIQSNVGLITGIPIQQTVDQLISISARPRDTLIARTQGLQAEQAAVDQLSSLVLGLRASLTRFSSSATFESQTVSSSNPEAVSASIAADATPAAGDLEITPLQTASASQFVSASFADIQDVIGAGELRFCFGGQVDRGAALRELNGGAGVGTGSIRVNDRSGASQVIDLRAAQTVDDVLQAINGATGVNINATVDGDRFVLTDNSGGGGTLTVQDVGLGTTATDLGLTGAAAGGTLTGGDVFRLSGATRLDTLNDGAGVRIADDLTEVADLVVTLADGARAEIDLSGAATLGDVVDAINTATDADGNDLSGVLVASVSADGNGLTLTDNSGGSANDFTVENGAIGSAATDLGIETATAGATIAGGRLASGLRDTLVASLNGGRGFALGEIALTDSAGGAATVDLTGAETLGEIVQRINDAAGVDVSASINDDRSGLRIVDNAGGPGTLTVANGAAGATADDLGIATSGGLVVNGGSLNRQTVSEATLLADFNGGRGVALGDFRITDSAGATGAVDLNTSGSEAQTIGDVIDRINALGIGVTAGINTTGDGIQLTDTAGGDGTLTVAEVGTGTAAADLRLAGASTTTNDADQQTIDGSTTSVVDLSDLTQEATAISLASLNAGEGVDQGVFNVVATNGDNFVVDLGEVGSEAFTIGDVIDRINEAAASSGVAVTAALNEAGTGIELTDAAGGDGQLTVEDLGTGSAAADLSLIRTAADDDDNAIDGAGLFSAAAGEQGALTTLAERINDLGAGVTASVLQDANGFRLTLTGDATGVANELRIDAGGTDLTFVQTSQARDAVALVGAGGALGGVAVTSSTNDFDSIVTGVDVSLGQATGESVTVSVAPDSEPLVDAVQDFVNAYNSIRANLDSVTAFDAEAATTGILFGRNEAVRVDSDLARVVSGRLGGGGDPASLEAIGVSLDDSGRLSLSRSELQAAIDSDPAGVEALLTDENTGLVDQLNGVIDQLAFNENSLLSSRSQTLQGTIDNNNDRITTFNASLTRERERLLLDFFRLEESIALLQSNLSAISAIQPVAIANNNANAG